VIRQLLDLCSVGRLARFVLFAALHDIHLDI